MGFCPSCGTQISNAKFCHVCGKPSLSAPVTIEQTSKKWKALRVMFSIGFVLSMSSCAYAPSGNKYWFGIAIGCFFGIALTNLGAWWENG